MLPVGCFATAKMTTRRSLPSSLGLFLLPVFCIGWFSGCGPSGPVTAPVQGTVTFKGKPVTTGKVMFFPSEGRASSGPIESDGTYQLRDGALIGSHRVTIKATEVTNVPREPKTFEEEMQGIGTVVPQGRGPRIEWLVPKSYSQRDTSPLTTEVVEGEENVIDFDLPQ